MDADWDGYLDAFHRDRAGITEDLLRDARLSGMDPYSWVWTAVTSTAGPVIDVGCGSGPVEAAGVARWVGIDRSAEELRVARARGRSPLVRATAAALPIRTAASDTALCVMSLQILSPLDDVIRELGRVLRPGGQLVVLLPARRPLPVRDLLLYARLQRALGQAIGYPNDDRLEGKGLAVLAGSHGFSVEDDVRARFALPLRTAADAEQLVRSLYLPGVAEARVGRAVALVDRRVGRSVTIPLRRVVLRRHTRAERSVAVQGFGEVPEPADGDRSGSAAGPPAERLLDLAGRFGGGVTAGTATHVTVDPLGGGRVELAVDPGVDDAAGPEVLDWVHVPETR